MINIGPLNEPSDIVDLMLECHDRIRSFVALAAQLSKATTASDDEIRDAAARVSRYFSEALPFHVADEEQSVIPRLAGKNPELDAALQDMKSEHLEHDVHVQVLIETCNTLKVSPGMLDALRGTLSAAASALETEFAKHLKQEEEIILPAIRTLITTEQREIMVAELRQRRNSKT